MSQNQEPPTVAQVVGHNARRLRGEHTADAVARQARAMGMKCSTGRISELEGGRVSPTLPTLFVLADALGQVTGQPVSLAELVKADGFIRVNDDLVVRAEKIAEAVGSSPVKLKLRDVQGAVEEVKDVLQQSLAEWREIPDYLGEIKVGVIERAERQSGETEERVAKSVGIGMLRMHHESAYLWGDSFSAERNRRAGPEANAQKRGRVSRELKAELKASISRGRD